MDDASHSETEVPREGWEGEMMAAATQTGVRLGNLGTTHVWFTSVGQPAGCDLIAEDGGELHLPGDSIGGDGPWWNLTGSVDGDRWEWDGDGEPRDWKSNTVTRIVAYLPE